MSESGTTPPAQTTTSGGSGGGPKTSFQFSGFQSFDIAFLVLNFFIIAFGVLCFWGRPFGIVIGIIACLTGLLGYYSMFARENRGFFIYLIVMLLLVPLAVINIFVIAIHYVDQSPPAYTGHIGLVVLGPVMIWLSWRVRGKSLKFNS